MNKIKTAICSLLALFGVSCQTGPGPVPIDNPKASPQQNYAAKREILSWQMNTVAVAVGSGHLKIGTPYFAAADKFIGQQRTALAAEEKVVFAPPSAAAGYEDIISIVMDVIAYVPSLVDGARVAQLVGNAHNMTDAEISICRENGKAADYAYDAAIGRH